MKKILIADDEPHISRLIKIKLEQSGYTVDSVTNGRDAFEYICNHAPDVLITDLQMPYLTGKELCQKINDHIPDRKFPIIITTSRTEIEYREWVATLDNVSFIEKPVSINSLKNTINGYFSTNDTDEQ